MFEEEIVTEVWIETTKEIFPDFIAHDKGNKTYEREPQKLYIEVRKNLRNFKDLGIGSSWNKYGQSKFFEKVSTSLFSNVSAFQVKFDGKLMPTNKFRELWEKKVLEFIE